MLHWRYVSFCTAISLLLITVSFMPVFTLQAQEGRLFKPLAFTKTYSMAMASIVAVTVIPQASKINAAPNCFILCIAGPFSRF